MRAAVATSGFYVVMATATIFSGCRHYKSEVGGRQPPAVSRSLQMGGSKSVMTFFVTSRGPDNGGDLGGRGGAAGCSQTDLEKTGGAG